MKLNDDVLTEILSQIENGVPYKTIAQNFKISVNNVSYLRKKYKLPVRRIVTYRRPVAEAPVSPAPADDLKSMKRQLQLEQTIKKCLLDVLIEAGIIK